MPPRTFVAFDLETTGLNPKRDAIIEIGAVRFQDGRPRKYYSTCINPGRPLPVRIQQLTGIRPADVADAPSIDDVIPEILGFFGDGSQAVVAHSAGFDISFLRAAGVKLKAPVLDTYELATILLPGQDSYSLGELCRALAIPLTSAHRASHRCRGHCRTASSPFGTNQGASGIRPGDAERSRSRRRMGTSSTV